MGTMTIQSIESGPHYDGEDLFFIGVEGDQLNAYDVDEAAKLCSGLQLIALVNMLNAYRGEAIDSGEFTLADLAQRYVRRYESKV